jgi:2-polyprenyl-3-methyl-5-hydroxy-6-metoxy-1,4-benzoquinol methylase
VADGEGHSSVWPASQGMKVEAFDISTVGVEKARRLAAEDAVSVDFNVADCDPWN